jgi:hypothetical protein
MIPSSASLSLSFITPGSLEKPLFRASRRQYPISFKAVRIAFSPAGSVEGSEGFHNMLFAGEKRGEQPLLNRSLFRSMERCVPSRLAFLRSKAMVLRIVDLAICSV